MNDLIIPSEHNKDIVLSQIDALHEEHRLNVFRALAMKYNNDGHDHPIDLDKYGNNAFDLIISLWMRNVKVPSGMGLGDPHDKTLFNYSRETCPSDYLVENDRLVVLLHNSPLVRFYLISGVDMRDSGHVILI